MTKNRFRFSEQTKAEAAERQQDMCASCGDPLSDSPTHAHHTGITVQEARELGLEKQPDYVRSADNCSIVCEPCHQDFVHDGGRTRTATEDTSALPHTHGNDLAANQRLATEHEVARENYEARASAVSNDPAVSQQLTESQQSMSSDMNSGYAVDTTHEAPQQNQDPGMDR